MFSKNNTQSERNYSNLPKFDLEGKRPYIVGAKLISDHVIVFTLGIDGAQFYGLRVVENNGKMFISMPQSKGSDGKWYDLYKLFFDEKSEGAIICTVCEHYVQKGEAADYKTHYEV